MTRKTIAVDIDDVLAAGSEGFAEFSNQRWGMNLTAENYDEDFRLAWGVDLEEALRRVDEYLNSGAHGKFRHFDDAHPVLSNLARRYNLITLTSRRRLLKPETDAWLDQHFPGIFKDFVYAGIFDDHKGGGAVEHLNRTKAEILKQLGASYLIDDHPKHCFAAAEAGVISILFGDYRWNRDIKVLPPNVVRAKTWSDVLRYFDAQG